MKLYIKYMVSLRCKLLVKAELKNLGLHYTTVELGIVEIMENITAEKREKLKTALLASGLELMDDKKAMLIEKIKIVITEMIHYNDELPKVNYSDYISKIMGYDYTYLANIFSEVKGITIEHYIIAHKIEKVKELLLYDELNLTEISYRMNYSSVSHLSTQFKKVTGLTPTFFKNLQEKKRNTLDNL
ncbi:helix-turn-helix transcriptional regulator [Flavobacterium sp. J49]|uniref:helix-turn-helix domain-containing protein n=1 Tax=Flavobacterium sp. J49 TaxID=2718534 RepID=UPI0015945B44|nr:AraC family transcriptional regulator [Flavobacterium sp. J49]MBF6641947.1 helix-turn-helix transcriptional regulator [Flavobacterium sp. J49]NIC03194.1 helix-turn-helix transcriptional regulator [Flavobacterium sp. J49]